MIYGVSHTQTAAHYDYMMIEPHQVPHAHLTCQITHSRDDVVFITVADTMLAFTLPENKCTLSITR